MKPFFNSPESIAKLQLHAGQWLGTPFMPHGCVKGQGVCCQRLVGAIYKETGFLPDDMEIPTGPMDWSHAQKRSLIADFVATRPEFSPPLAVHVADVLPGDMVGFRVGGCLHHCGIVLATDGQFIHCVRGRGTFLSNIRDATYFQRLEKIWRPLRVATTN